MNISPSGGDVGPFATQESKSQLLTYESRKPVSNSCSGIQGKLQLCVKLLTDTDTDSFQVKANALKTVELFPTNPLA